tara:strand:+ start:50 stop:652 length:603 start_codon:yes stop_codon:yes gene_type:complete
MKNLFKKLFTQETTQETQPKSSYDRNEDYWKQHYIEERKKLIDKIEELKKVYKVEADIFKEKNIKTSDSMDAFIQDLYKDEMMPKSLRFYNYLSNLAETTQNNNIYLVEKILDIIISHKKEENIDNSHRNWMSEQREYIEKRKEVLKHKEKELEEFDFNKEVLKHKEKELEEREANIVKIEASQIILNSELAKELTINLK